MHRRGRWTTGLFLAGVVVAGLAAAAPAVAEQAGAPGAAASAVVEASPAEKGAAPQPPVKISADKAEYFNKEGTVIFTGSVVVVQEDSTLTAERMDVTFEKPAQQSSPPAEGIGAPANAQRISKIVAQEKVSFRQIDPETKKERYATGDTGVYDVAPRTVTMTGNARLWEGKNVIVGEEMVFHLEDKKVVVKGKVNLTVYPDEVKEGKKP